MLLKLKIFLKLELPAVVARRIEINPSTSLLSSAVWVVNHLWVVKCDVACEVLQLHLGVLFLETFTAFHTYFPCCTSSWTCIESHLDGRGQCLVPWEFTLPVLLAVLGGFPPSGICTCSSCPACASIFLARANWKSLYEIFFPSHEERKMERFRIARFNR